MSEYKTDLLFLRNMDCMDLMREYPDKHFELAIVDPPYGIDIAKSGTLNQCEKMTRGFNGNKQYEIKNWDKNIPSSEYFLELKRVSKKQIIWGGNFFFDFLGSCKCLIIWYKKGLDKNPLFSPFEAAWTNLDRVPGYVDIPWIGFGQINSGENKIHPTQKPVALYKWILHNYAKQGDKILDTHGGSMSIAIACHQMGFDLTLSELDEDYYEAGIKRVKLETAQRDLFTDTH